MKNIIAAVIGVGIATVAAIGITPAASASPPPPFTCPSRTICNFANQDYTGSVYEYSLSSPNNQNVWLSIPSLFRGSVNNNTASSLEVWDDQTGGHYCIPPGTREDLFNGYGYEYANYHSGNCDGVPNR